MACDCEPVTFYPVCSKDGTSFYSPCHAGCRNMTVTHNNTHKTLFSDCACVSSNGSVAAEWCEDDCNQPMIIFLIFMSISAFVSGTNKIPSILLTLRSVPPELRSFSLGFRGFLISLLGSIPSPIIYGLIIDGSCLLWNDSCGISGSCAIYEAKELRLRLHLVKGCICLLGIAIDVVVWYFAKNLKLFEEPEDTDENNAKDEMKPKTSDSAHLNDS